MDVEVIADTECVVGEDPLWHPKEKRLYWTDIDRGHLYRYDPSTGEYERIYEGRPVGGFTFQEDGGLLLFRDKGNVVAWREGEEVGTVVEQVDEEAALEGGRFNDVIADPAGRVFCGTLSRHSGGRLYRLDTDGKLTRVLSGLTLANGMGFSPDLGKMYLTDSSAHTIWRFDYDRASGELTNREAWTRTPDDDGGPDGLTVDAEGAVWSARWDGWSAVRLSAEGEEIGRIRFEAKQVSSMIFGGEGYDVLYVTTAGGQDRSANGPQAGALLRADPGVRGKAEFFSRVRLP